MDGMRTRAGARLRTALLVAGLVAAGVVAAAPPAAAAIPVVGALERAEQAANGTITVSGWAFDGRSPATSIRVTVWVDGRFAHLLPANRPRPDIDRSRQVTGRHGYALRFAWHPGAHRIELRINSGRARIAVRGLRQASPGPRIVAFARTYVGISPYVDGGASPSGFDCSGYTLYVYRQARVAALPHNAEAQRHLMRIIPRSQVRPGDLIFYMAGGSAFHVAIYAGNGMQYAAATPQDGLRYQGIWSSDVQFGTDWH